MPYTLSIRAFVVILFLCLQVARDRRRAAAVVEQEARNRDPTNPNWEFQQMIDDFKEDLDLQPLQDGDPIANNRITVCIRKRPLSSKEEKARDVDVVTMASRDHVTIHEPKTKVDLTKFLENQQFRYKILVVHEASFVFTEVILYLAILGLI